MRRTAERRREETMRRETIQREGNEKGNNGRERYPLEKKVRSLRIFQSDPFILIGRIR
jgi:hypothetical protein